MAPNKQISQNETDVNVALAQLEGQLSTISGQIVALKEVFELKISGLEKATTLAADNMEVRLEGMNEWRQQSKDREEAWATKTSHADLDKRVSSLEIDRATLAGKVSQTSVYIVYLISVAGIIMALLKTFAT
jgi:hypothetical protein